MVTLEMFNRTVDLLNQAALDDTHYLRASALIDQACRTKGNHLIFSTPSPSGPHIRFKCFCYRGDHRTDLETEYYLKYHHTDEHVPRLRRLPDSRITPVKRLFDEQRIKQSPTYNLMMPHFHFQNGLNVRMDGPDGSSIVWGLADPLETASWSSEQLKTVARLLPHIRQFVHLRAVLGHARMLTDSFTRLLDNTRIGIIQLDRHGRILEANAKACEALLSGALSDRSGYLGAPLPDHDRRLQSLLAAAIPSGGGPGSSASLTLPARSGRGSITLHVHPLAGDPVASVGGKVAAFALVADSRVEARIDSRWVATLFGLSRAESRVAASLAEGRSVSDIARSFNRTEGGVRWTLKQVYRKLGISKQSDLVRLLLTVSNLARNRFWRPY